MIPSNKRTPNNTLTPITTWVLFFRPELEAAFWLVSVADGVVLVVVSLISVFVLEGVVVDVVVLVVASLISVFMLEGVTAATVGPLVDHAGSPLADRTTTPFPNTVLPAGYVTVTDPEEVNEPVDTNELM